jgi:hypothetical protein
VEDQRCPAPRRQGPRIQTRSHGSPLLLLGSEGSSVLDDQPEDLTA